MMSFDKLKRLSANLGTVSRKAQGTLGKLSGKSIGWILLVGLVTVIHFFVSVPLANALRSLFKASSDAMEGLGGGTTTPSFPAGLLITILLIVGAILVSIGIYRLKKKDKKVEEKEKPKKKDDSYHWYPFWAYWFYWPGLIGSYVWLVGYVMPRVLFLLPFKLNPVLAGIALALPFIGHARTLTDGNRKGPRPVVLGIGHVFSVLGVVVYLFIIFMTITGQLIWCRDVWGTGTCRFVGALFGAIWTNIWL